MLGGYGCFLKTATWTQINANISEGPSNDYSNFFTKSGSIPLSCLIGTVHVAFQYFGGDGGVTTTLQIDNVKNYRGLILNGVLINKSLQKLKRFVY